MSVQVLDERAPMRDGTLLAADVVLADPATQRPVLLIRTPYSRGAMRLVHDVVGLARSGWVVVVQDVRGRFDSGGRFAAFTQEVDDGYDTIEWCATQPWSDGRVVMTGWSYVGATQWLAALSKHPALLAINPIVGAGDIGEAMLYEGGAFQIGLVQPWVLGLAASDPAATGEDRQRAGQIGAGWASALRAAPAEDPVSTLVPDYAAWRRGQHPPVSIEAVDVAAFQVAGWYDIFLESSLRHWQIQAASGRPQRLVIGPWSHSNGLSNLHPEVDFGPTANGAYGGVLGQALDWVRRAIDGAHVESGISCFVMHDGWRELPSWPPDVTLHDLHLSPGGMLGADPRELHDLIRHDPHSPVPTRGGRVLGPFLPLPGPVDQRSVEERDDVLVYTGEPLDVDLLVIGMVEAFVSLASTGASADIAVKLCDVQLDGRSINVVDSIRRLDLTSGGPSDFHVSVGSTAYRFAEGHRVRIELAGSNHPRFDVNPSTGEPPGTARALLPAEHTVLSGWIRLPVCS